MIDITTTRTMATQMHPPTIIFAMLILLALTGALLAGVGMGGGKAGTGSTWSDSPPPWRWRSMSFSTSSIPGWG